MRSILARCKQFLGKRVVAKIVFIALGISSTVWFLVRVIPKPQRATYPCMQAAAPVMSGFVVYLLTLFGTVVSFVKMKQLFRQRRFVYGSFFVAVTIIATLAFLSQKTEKVFAQTATKNLLGANMPVGKERGIFPGRVVWSYMPGVTKWDGNNGKWYDDSNISQDGATKMLSQTLMTLTGKKTEAKAWEALFVYFNKVKKGKALGYQAGQKIAIKINENNNTAHANSDEINASPQMVLAIVASLVNEARVPQKNITVAEPSRFISDNVYNKVHTAFPDVVLVDNIGGQGRVKSTYVDTAIHYSANNGKLARGLATCIVEADYLINLALLKGHVGQGVTLCAKNFYGVTSINNDWRQNAHNNFDQDRNGKPKYMTFVDFMGHKHMGEKTMLFLVDGLIGSKLVNGAPGPKWNMPPFNNNWPCSLFASQDMVAVDAVCLDFLKSEWPDARDMNYSDQYLIEAAQADNPPSKTFYDPEHDGVKCTSLGVMEHWNNAKDKKYSRNLGKSRGIELVKI
ncbi:MAG: DUF362 domain-containing protein [Bacteroidota bacterium]|nr:DUF362 domain-containing protein [Bacteroidota bacterium]